MLRTLKNLFKQDREKFVVPKSCRQEQVRKDL